MSEAEHLSVGAGGGLDRLYRRYAVWLHRRIRAKVGPDAAADVVQDTYLRVAPYAANGIRHPKAFLLQVATNLLKDQHRQQMRREGSGFAAQVAQAEAPPQFDQVLLAQIVRDMPQLYRAVAYGTEHPPTRPVPYRRPIGAMALGIEDFAEAVIAVADADSHASGARLGDHPKRKRLEMVERQRLSSDVERWEIGCASQGLELRIKTGRRAFGNGELGRERSPRFPGIDGVRPLLRHVATLSLELRLVVDAP